MSELNADPVVSSRDELLKSLQSLRPENRSISKALTTYKLLRDEPSLEPQAFIAVLDLIERAYGCDALDALDEATEIKNLARIACPDGKPRLEKLPDLIRFYEWIYDIDSLEPIGGAMHLFQRLVGPTDEVLRLIFRTVHERDEGFNREAWQYPAMDLIDLLPDRGIGACSSYATEAGCWFRFVATREDRNLEGHGNRLVSADYWRYELIDPNHSDRMSFIDQGVGRTFLGRFIARRGLIGLQELLDFLSGEPPRSEFEAAIGPGGEVRYLSASEAGDP